MHKGFLPSRRDDIESMLYVLLYIINGTIPWNNICVGNQRVKNNQYKSAKERIITLDSSSTNNSYILKLVKILKIITCVEYASKPQYSLFRQILNTT